MRQREEMLCDFFYCVGVFHHVVVSNIGTVHEQLLFKTDRYVGGTRAEDGQEPGRCDTGSNLAKPITSSLFGSLRRNVFGNAL